MNTVPGRSLTEPDWLAARIAEMGRSWGTTELRVSGTLWWCMVASALVEQQARAYAHGETIAAAALDRLDCEVRPDGGVDRIHIMAAVDEADRPACAPTAPAAGADVLSGTDTEAPAATTAVPSETGAGAVSEIGAGQPVEPAAAVLTETGAAALSETGVGTRSETEAETLNETGLHVPDEAGPQVPNQRGAAADRSSAKVLYDTLTAVIAPVAAVSGAGVPALWAIAADAIGNRALDAGAPEAGARLAEEIGGRLPMPRFIEVNGRTFVRRMSCCLVFEVPGCEMCTSCPKRPAAERTALLEQRATKD